MKRHEYVKCSTALQLHKGVMQMIYQDILSALIHPNVKVHLHNVNDRGYHKMWSPASSTRTMTNISYYTIQYWNSNDNKLLARCDLLWKKKYYVWSQDVSNVIILQIDGHRLITVQDVSQIPISIEWAVLAHQCGSNMILTTTSMMCRGSRLQDVISAWLSVEA